MRLPVLTRILYIALCEYTLLTFILYTLRFPLLPLHFPTLQCTLYTSYHTHFISQYHASYHTSNHTSNHTSHHPLNPPGVVIKVTNLPYSHPPSRSHLPAGYCEEGKPSTIPLFLLPRVRIPKADQTGAFVSCQMRGDCDRDCDRGPAVVLMC